MDRVDLSIESVDGLQPRICPVQAFAFLKSIEQIFFCNPVDSVHAAHEIDFEVIEDVLPLLQNPANLLIRPVAMFLSLCKIHSLDLNGRDLAAILQLNDP